MSVTRRRLLRAGGALAVAAALPGRAAAGAAAVVAMGPAATAPGVTVDTASMAKRLALNNLHTSERLDVVFSRGTDYVPDSLAAIQGLLRDFRNGEQHAIDPTLLDYLFDLAQRIGADPVFSVISGYRSPQTNEQLRARSDGVSRHSLHMEGRAIDVRLAGVDCADLAARAREMTRGGVGYYRMSNFVHLDTGAYRTWNG